MGQEHRTFRMRGEGKRMEINRDKHTWDKCTAEEAFA
jgi:hypothetical protein